MAKGLNRETVTALIMALRCVLARGIATMHASGRTIGWAQRRPIRYTEEPGCIASSIRRIFSAVVYRQRRCKNVTTSPRLTREIGSDDIVISTGRSMP